MPFHMKQKTLELAESKDISSTYIQQEFDIVTQVNTLHILVKPFCEPFLITNVLFKSSPRWYLI